MPARKLDDTGSISHFRSRSIERNISAIGGGKLWHSKVPPLISISRCDSNGRQNRAAEPERHGRTNPTDRTNAGVKRRRSDVTGAARLTGPKSAGATPPTPPAGGRDREAKARAGRAEPAPGRTRAWPRGDERQAFAFARDPGTRRVRLPKETRADPHDPRKFF